MQLLMTALQTVYKDILMNALYFPIWWYTKGTAKFFNYIIAEIRDFAKGLNISVLFKYLLKPMYGYFDFWSRVISFLVRIVHFFVLFLITIIWTIILFVLFFIWLILPVFVLYNVLLFSGILKFNIYLLVS